MENLRIRFVGFFYDNTNYIVDIDNREVTYKILNCATYRKLENRITTFTNPINSSLTLSFKTFNNSSTIEVELYPNCIKHCTVCIINESDHLKKILSEEYYNFDYFSATNLLDKNGNIFTFVDYNDVFDLTTGDLSDMFTHKELIHMLHKNLENIENQKNFSVIIKEFLEDIKRRLDYPSPLKEE